MKRKTERELELEYDNTVLRSYIRSAARALNDAENFVVRMYNKRLDRAKRAATRKPK